MTIFGTKKFLANFNYEHGSSEKIGVLLVNLGTPEISSYQKTLIRANGNP